MLLLSPPDAAPPHPSDRPAQPCFSADLDCSISLPAVPYLLTTCHLLQRVAENLSWTEPVVHWLVCPEDQMHAVPVYGAFTGVRGWTRCWAVRQKSWVPGRRVVVFLSLFPGAQFLRGLNRCTTNSGDEQNRRWLRGENSCLISIMECLQVLHFVPQDENSFIFSVCCSSFLDCLAVVCFEQTKETTCDFRKNSRLRA